jgi:hypothetical protein
MTRDFFDPTPEQTEPRSDCLSQVIEPGSTNIDYQKEKLECTVNDVKRQAFFQECFDAIYEAFMKQ